MYDSAREGHHVAEKNVNSTDCAMVLRDVKHGLIIGSGMGTVLRPSVNTGGKKQTVPTHVGHILRY
jgi:hypothetical protein